MKQVKAVKPYIYPNQLNFKDKAFEAWKGMGLPYVHGWYPRWLHKLMFNFDMPTIWHGEARLVFVQPVSLYFDTFFVAPFHEMIPFIWDCWPKYDDMLVMWLKSHRVKVAIFTSSQARDRIQKRLPELKTLYCPEGIDVENYPEGKLLKDRTIDLYNYGRQPQWVKESDFSDITYMTGGTNDEFFERLQNSKVTIAVPRCDVSMEQTGGQETLTQRYWECMLSRIVLVGRAPKELVEFIGYNPVVELQSTSSSEGRTLSCQELIEDVLYHVEDYQELVDRNRDTALRLGDWPLRIGDVREWLQERQ